MYRDLGFIRVHRPQTRATTRARGAYCYLIYPHKPIVAYLPGSNSLLSEYCVEFPDRERAPLRAEAARLRRRAGEVDDDQGRRGAPDPRREHAPARAPGRPAAGAARPLAAGEWERERSRPRTAVTAAGRREAARRMTVDPTTSTPGAAAAPSWRARTARRRARTCTRSGSPTRTCSKPIVGVANTWIGTMPCNFHLRRLSAKVMEGIRAAGGTPLEYNTIAISDGITMGTEGMKTSLVSREVIADSIELVARGHLFDAVVALSGCDKTIPGTVMALARLDVPSLMLYGGSIAPGPLPRPRRHDPGRLRGGRRARRRARWTTRSWPSSSTRACPGAGRLRRPVHRQHDGDRLRGDGHLADGQRDGAGDGPAQGRGLRRGGQARDVAARAGPEARAT